MSREADTPNTVAAKQAAADWLDEAVAAIRNRCPDSPVTGFIWTSHNEPLCMHTWDLYCLDDYDYVVACPKEHYYSWTDRLGCCDVSVVDLPNGWTLYVGYHS